MSARKTVWVWLPGESTPVPAASLEAREHSYLFQYEPDYLGTREAPIPSVPLDPVDLQLKAKPKSSPTLPGVIHDAKPAGYGLDRLNARLQSKYGRALTDIELLEEGPADGIGAIEVCHDIKRKLDWRASSVELFKHELLKLEDNAPASRAMRRANNEDGTSAGGERPKATFADRGRLWLVKTQDRGDREGMPAMEFTAMTLAAKAEITVPDVDLINVGPHQAFMIERFDRAEDPARPLRHLFASAHTVMQLEPASVRGDPMRSYLHFADRLRVWGRSDPQAAKTAIQELWKRMAFSALVGNIDDHQRNHGVLFKGGSWQLSPAFDITPIAKRPRLVEADIQWWPSLAMATAKDGSTATDPLTLLASVEHFQVDLFEAAAYLLKTSVLVASTWEEVLRKALDPMHGTRPAGYVDSVVNSVRDAFSVSQRVADSPELVHQAVQRISAPKLGRRRMRP